MNKQDLLKLKKHLLKEWGSKCNDFNIECQLCVKWLAYAVLEEMVRSEDEYKSWRSGKGNHKSTRLKLGHKK